MSMNTNRTTILGRWPEAVHGPQEQFGHFARRVALAAGKPITFLTAASIVIVWAFTGPIFGFSDTWQLVINTGTTVITFLMVFLIQNTQNRDAVVMQVKLAELIITMRGAHNRLATAEDLTDEELRQLHAEYCARADHALKSLSARHEAHKSKR